MARSRGRAGQAERAETRRDRPGRDQHDLRARRGGGVASTSTSASTRSTSIVPAGVVSEDDPALTTIRRGLARSAVTHRACDPARERPPVTGRPAARSVPRGPHGRLAGPGGTSGCQSKTYPPSSAPMTTSAPALGAGLDQRLLDAEPLEPVGEVADGLVVGEVGLPDPPLRLLAGDLEAVSSSTRRTSNPASPSCLGRMTSRVGSSTGRAGARAAATISPIANVSSRRPVVGGGGDLEDPQPALLELGARPARPARGRRARPTLFSTTSRGRSVAARRRRRQLGLDHLEVGDRVAARLHGGAVEDVHERRRSARRGAGTRGPAPCPRRRPGSAPARRRR